MSKEIVMFFMLMVMGAFIQNGLGAGVPATLDIMGSKVNNTTIILPKDTTIGVDIIGSTTKNIHIGYDQTRPCSRGCNDCHGTCNACGGKKTYNTIWDDFSRPLCYPWSSYIPTRYNRPFTDGNQGYSSVSRARMMQEGKRQSCCDSCPEINNTLHVYEIP